MDKKCSGIHRNILTSGKTNARGCAPFEHSCYSMLHLGKLQLSCLYVNGLRTELVPLQGNRIEQEGPWVDGITVPAFLVTQANLTQYFLSFEMQIFSTDRCPLKCSYLWPLFSCLKYLVGVQWWQEVNTTALCSQPHLLQNIS